jgi:hypothetical protein
VNARDAAAVLLVRSVEEETPEWVASEARVEAERAAGPLSDEAGWFARRARALVPALPEPVQGLVASAQVPLAGSASLPLVAFGAGLVANYLGPGQQIHALYNPIALLVGWNAAVYAALVLRPVVRRSRPRRTAARGEATASGERAAAAGARPPPRPRHPRSPALWVLRRTLLPLWLRLQESVHATRDRARGLGRVARPFLTRWLAAAEPELRVAARQLLDLSALGLALGAVCGSFVRGLVLDYHVVWRSTFVTEPETVARVLGIAFGPALWLLGRPLPDADAARALLAADGVPAEEWIWLWAAAALLVIGIPRAAFAAARALQLRRRRGAVELPLDEPYYAEILARARAERAEEIARAIRTDVRVESGRFAEGLATWVCERLYDERVVPRLRGFREAGGRLRELEAAIAAECRDFQPELEAHFARASAEFEASLARAVARTVEGEVAFRTSGVERLDAELQSASATSAAGLSGEIGQRLARAIGSAVAGAVSMAVGTVSGGFGHSLGIAIVTSLLHVTGPVGFLIGAVTGLVLVGGAYLVGRERATDAVMNVRLPPIAARTALGTARLERLVAHGRERCHFAVRERIGEKLEPLAQQIAHQIWQRVRPLLATRPTRVTKGDVRT